MNELVIEAWETEVRERGPHWLRASELLTAYAYGKPSAFDEEAEAEGPQAPRELVVAALEALVRREEREGPRMCDGALENVEPQRALNALASPFGQP
ncbi:MAG: hypothetical protein INH41_05560 [Myxococcaceae bacterium]|nr:hypothetical protein [Myxococcaceae bacterium]MCA3011852.1 hypothetical protein [Myxococcaceae bacterium]